MASRFEQFLAGGLSTVIDGYMPDTPANAEDRALPETVSPIDPRTRDNANPPQSFIMGVTSEQILVTTAIVVAAIGLYAILTGD